MKIVGRILIILAVFALVMGVTYVIVNARGTSASGITNRLESGNGRFTPPEGAPQGFQNGQQPQFPREGREFYGERDGGEWLLEAFKNIAIIGVIVALIAIPRSWMQKRKRTAQTAAG
jgi:hypothetical protein